MAASAAKEAFVGARAYLSQNWGRFKCRSIMAALRRKAQGLATPLPAMSAATWRAPYVHAESGQVLLRCASLSFCAASCLVASIIHSLGRRAYKLAFEYLMLCACSGHGQAHAHSMKVIEDVAIGNKLWHQPILLI